MNKEEIVRNKIRALRFFNDWTQQDLADKSGVSKPSIWLIEQGRVIPEVETMRKIAQTFDRNVEEVFDINLSWDEREHKRYLNKKSK